MKSSKLKKEKLNYGTAKIVHTKQNYIKTL